MKKQYIAAVLLSGVVFSAFSFVQTASAATACTDLKATLSIGMNNSSNGSPVIALQDFLRAEGYLSAQSTGYFGTLTYKAVQSFQKAKGLQTVGSVGPLTRAEIKKTTCAVAAVPAAPTVPATSQLASVITAQPKIPTFSLPYKTESFGEWHNEWGNIGTTTSDSLLIRNTPDNTSAVAVLPNTGDWTDYKYTASVTISNGIVTLIARRVDDNNQLSCVFINNSVSIQQKINGDNEEVASVEVKEAPSSPYFQKSMNVSMRVKGNTVGCTLLGGDDNVTYTKVDNSLLKGGIGIGTWFEVGGSALLELKAVNVTAI